MGLFDLTSPIFNLLDSLMFSLPEIFKLIIWGLIAGYGSMWLFRRFSNQSKIQSIKSKVKANQKKMAEFEGEMSDLLPLVGQTLKLAFKQLGSALGPALLVSIPVIFMLAWMSNHYGLEQPVEKQAYLAEVHVVTDVNFQPDLYSWENSDKVRWGSDDQAWGITWPAENKDLLLNKGKVNILNIQSDSISPLVHKKQWWNSLIGNPMGYLPDDSEIEQIMFNFEAKKILEIGPSWMHGWMFTFFIAFLVFSLAFKFILRIA